MAIPHGTTVQQLTPTSRVNRRPSHTYHLRFKPWVIQPFMIAPVLPGETLRSLQLQTRAVTKPIANALIGWWFEQYVFYVKHRDLAGREDFVEMVLTQGTSLAAYDRAATVDTFHNGTHIDWTWECLKRVTECYFRDEDEAYDVSGGTLSGMPLAKVGGSTYLDSLVTASTLPYEDTADASPSIDDANTDFYKMNKWQETWRLLFDQGMTNLTYEEWLRTYGVRLPKGQEEHKPELIRFVRDWTYPSNTINPSTGAPSSACSWAISERADKDRFFSEPGFIFGVAVCRPKVYFSGCTGAAVSVMRDAISWLPALLQSDPAMSLSQNDHTEGPMRAGATGTYWFDIKDLFLYGDQFLNFAVGGTDYNKVALPTSTYGKDYVASSDITALFVSGGTVQVDADGICTMTIAGSMRDTT